MKCLFIPALCLLSLPAPAQEQPAAKPANAPQQNSKVPKGRQQMMERHTRTTWHYHSGPRRSGTRADSGAAKQAPSPKQTTTNDGN